MTTTIDALVEALEAAREYVDSASRRMYDGTNGHGIRQFAEQNLVKIDAALALARAEQAEPVNWPLLEKPAKLGGGTFGKGCSARLVVESAYRHAEYDSEEQAQTPEQSREAEMARRKLFDMLNPPAAPAKLEPLSPEEIAEPFKPFRTTASTAFVEGVRFAEAAHNAKLGGAA